DRIEFLKKNQRYAKAGVFTAKSPEDQADALKLAKYATDPNYNTVLKNLISRLNLEDLDAECFHV
ncbi:MAG: peptidoglycan hydrolase, partial [Azospira oryzae]